MSDNQSEDRWDFVMGILVVCGAVITIAVPLVLMAISLVILTPFLNSMVMICQTIGCIIMAIGFAYFICRKEA